MANRLDLHQELCDILGSKNVYFQPPTSLSMKYPCIKYSLSGIDSRHADDLAYKNDRRYEIIVIDSNPDSEIPDKILTHFKMCSFDRGYPADNLNHFALSLYY